MNITGREYILLVVGLLAAVCFFVIYPSQDPRSTIELTMDKSEIRQKAEQKLDSFGYAVQQFDSDVSFGVRSELLDTLQERIGRPQLINQLREGTVQNISAFYWEVTFDPITDSQQDGTHNAGSDEPEEGPGRFEEGIQMRFDMNGDLLEMRNSQAIMPLAMVHRPVLSSLFGDEREQAKEQLAMLSDSVISRQFLVEMRPRRSEAYNRQETMLSRLARSLEQERPFRLYTGDIENMASYYLSRTGWEPSVLQGDTVRLGRIGNISTATIRYDWTNPQLRQQQSISLRVTATGALIDMNTSYQLGSEEGVNLQEIWPVLRNALIFLFCLGGIIIFFFRIRARAIDTKPALMIAILGGTAAAVAMLLSVIPQVDFFTDPNNWTTAIVILIGVGITGAAASLAFFVFSAIGDSITRQHWPEKLNIYDYLRQGMIFNKPVGYAIMRSVILAFIMVGLWTVMLWLLPHLYIDISQVFLHEKAVWAPLYLLLYNGWGALSVVLGIFLVLGGQAYAQTKSKITASLLMIFACIVVAPVVGSYGPVTQELIMASAMGLALVFIYLEWDAVTVLLSYFLFLGLVRTSAGWTVDGTLDGYVFLFYMMVIGGLFLFGIVAALQGREEQSLSRFVPEYVEELAQEERIKQELQIAREVQQSFLPVKTPEFEYLELAAICKPAYETGGDYYDFIQLDDHRVAVTIGDVSGKGIQAAFYMTFIKGILHSLCREIESPAELLKKTNRLFCDNAARGVFISLVYGIIDLEKQEFYFARAGHNPILHVNAAAGSIRELQPRGLGIGLTTGKPFDDNIEEMKLQLDRDDLLILYTDGIVEALNENHTFYGTHRFNNLLGRQGNASAANILTAISEDVNAYIGNAKQHDDMTMVVMKLVK
ncbi:PP2C family protein-serine/threonine phosphatase [Fodinibius sediminis]|uniref:Serine phosphatase RsbU, regulator of sigma subunit n=1 Tax=Fodinibius sediminis TaxID=1214077 RepID=A0A521C672_9BACT|nr:PP2C family protein-serine/threonine phosphatase [Fodinibius sediminis]SMO54893.1 Serine phosphatase RsbU, regulator of sigma subunit [Fodinibius sediminis]